MTDLPDPGDWEEVTLETQVRLDELLQAPGDRIWYNYDFGDNWMHVVELLDVRPGARSSARVLAAANACPPEDIGASSFYQELVDLSAARADQRPQASAK